MARLITKKSTVQGKVPLAADLEIGELAVNTADSKLYTKHSDGSIKEIAASQGGGSGFTPAVISLTATQASTVVALADITGFTATLAANSVYECTAFITFRSAATTTGINLGFSSVAGSIPMLEITVPLTSTAVASQLRKIFPNAAESTTGNVLGTGVTAINSNHTAKVHGIITTGANSGSFTLRFATEVAASAITLQIGSTLVLKQIK